MLNVSDLKLAYGKRVLFSGVNINFSPGNCYGLIGANGSGKSTFLKIISGEVEPNEGSVSTRPGERIAILRQDQYEFDEHAVLDTVIMGYAELFNVLKERDEIYSKDDFSDADGIRAAEIEELVEEMNGYEAGSDAAVLLNGLGIPEEFHQKKMKELDASQKVRVLLAQALFGNPDSLLLDEPTNNLDLEAVRWLENFIYGFRNTVIVVSHDRHFMNRVCTHIADIDFGKITVYAGNYDFWAEASQLAMQQKKDENRKKEDKVKELKSFVERFSSNASKAKQATSRKKLIEKLSIDDLPVTSRKFPFISFKPERECGRMILEIKNLKKKIEGEPVIKNFSMTLNRGDKIAFVGPNNHAKKLLFEILAGNIKPDSGSYRWGETITVSYFPAENSSFFEGNLNLINWLKQYTTVNDETYVRGFLGRMLFSGDESLKQANVLSGGERVRCMLSRMMLSGANALILDDPTNHLDLESITSLNNALINFSEIVLFTSHDHQFIDTIANRIIEITPSGIIDRAMTFEEYIQSDTVKNLRDEMYGGHQRMAL